MTEFLMMKDKTKAGCLWQYREPLTCVSFGFPSSPTGLTHFATFQDLVRRVDRHIRDNNLQPPVDLAWIIEDQICRGLDARLVKERPQRKEEPDGKPVKSRTGGVTAILRRIGEATATIGKQMLDGEWAPPHLVTKRARICAVCPWIKQAGIGNCPTCLAFVHSLAGGRRNVADGPLDGKACGICDCFPTAKIHYDIKVIVEKTRTELWPLYEATPKCWITQEKKDIENANP